MDHADKYPYTRAERIGFLVLLVICCLAAAGITHEIVRHL